MSINKDSMQNDKNYSPSRIIVSNLTPFYPEKFRGTGKNYYGGFY